MKGHVRPAFYIDIVQEELWLLERAGAEVEALWQTIEFLDQHPFRRGCRDLKDRGIRSWRVKGFERWLIF